MRTLLLALIVAGMIVPTAALADEDLPYGDPPAGVAAAAVANEPCKDRLVKVWFTVESMTRRTPDGETTKWSGTIEACVEPSLQASVIGSAEALRQLLGRGNYLLRDGSGKVIGWVGSASTVAANLTGTAVELIAAGAGNGAKWLWQQVVPSAYASPQEAGCKKAR